MNSLLNLLLKGLFISLLLWLFVYQTNPIRVCSVHPKKELRSTFYQCEPFGFELDFSKYPSGAGQISGNEEGGRLKSYLEPRRR
jgi:hypothetical protein